MTPEQQKEVKMKMAIRDLETCRRLGIIIFMGGMDSNVGNVCLEYDRPNKLYIVSRTETRGVLIDVLFSGKRKEVREFWANAHELNIDFWNSLYV